MTKITKVRTRFAPSPTGSMHIGNLRTAFYAYALAKHGKGDFVLRIEDTDKKREVKGEIEEIKTLLTTFDIKWDEYYVQSDRLKLYKSAAQKLVNAGHAFYCGCEGKNSKKEGFSTQLRDVCRNKGLTAGAVKLKVPNNETVSFKDFVLKEDISWQTDVVFDATLLKSDGFPTYHLAVVVDDHDMNITHVLRGHDWLPSTPIHLLIYKYLGYEVPQIGHLTDILDPEGGKLSKRKGSTSVKGLLNDGYLPEALFNFVILAGWAPKDNMEIFNVETFVKFFDPAGFQKSNPVFNHDKLDWFNGYYIRQKSDNELGELLRPYLPDGVKDQTLEKIISLIKERIKKLSDFRSFAGFFFEKPNVDKGLLGKNFEVHLKKAIDVIENVNVWNLENLNEKITKTVKENGYKTGDFFMDLRVALTGSRFTPPINDSIIILGKDESLERIKRVL